MLNFNQGLSLLEQFVAIRPIPGCREWLLSGGPANAVSVVSIGFLVVFRRWRPRGSPWSPFVFANFPAQARSRMRAAECHIWGPNPSSLRYHDLHSPIFLATRRIVGPVRFGRS